MIIADQILILLFQSDNYSQTLFNNIKVREGQGEDVCQLEWQYILLGEYNRILADFYSNNFDAEGQIVTPDYETITLAQADQIMSQIKIAIGNNKYPLTNIFQLGIWFEALNWNWDDAAGDGNWYDSPPLS